MAETRFLWCFKYENKALQGVHSMGLLWYDSLLQDVQYQSGGTITSWHGSLVQKADGYEIKFDCRAHGDHVPQLKCTKVVNSNVEGQFVGWDYAGRFIALTYLSKWEHAGNTWRLHSTWDEELRAWVVQEVQNQ